MPSQIFVSMTPALRTFLDDCKAEGAKALAAEDSADLDELYRLEKRHCELGGAPAKLHELLDGTEVVERRESPLLGEDGAPLSELELMRRQSQERSYQRMVDGVAPLTGLRRVEPDVNHQGIRFATNFGTQVIVAFIGAFVLGYFFVENFVAPHNFNAKVIAGACCSFATLLLETLLLVVHEEKVARNDKKREKIEQRAEKARMQPSRAGKTSAGSKVPDKAKQPQEKKDD
eukprot:TRINITY_DN73380_c0_g1_i1.p1 TRINITY_DN73380_c0_g1~~TRINITY_DN73380_c0_g1_i1.p1  ORF type:complete len:231 (+),score=57.92 TRINITY_DN73380_c0_g1_i1:85-777(+)